MENILKALQSVKNKVGALSKTETNPFYNSKYFDINSLLWQVEPLLEENGLLLLQPIEKGFVKSVIYHVESGESVSSEIELNGLTDPQKIGSAVTYFRRYTLQSLLGLQAEDDDANKASTPTPTANNQTPQTNEPTEWLNLFDKQGNKLKSYTDLETAIASGKKYTLAGIRKTYKVSKVVAEELKNHFSIE
jgi:hypothetical protein